MGEKKRELLVVDLAGLRSSLGSWCKSRGTTPSKAVRAMILEKCGVPIVEEKPVVAASGRAQVRLELRLSAQERRSLETHASKRGEATVQQLVLGLLREAMTGEAYISTQEMQALGESNYQLLKASGNLNQVARRLNAATGHEELVEAAGTVAADIKAHVQVVAQALKTRKQGWSVLNKERWE